MPTMTDSRIARYRMISNDLSPFALIEGMDGTVTTRWVSGASVRGELRKLREDRAMLRDLVTRLEGYFAGEDVDFSDVPLPREAGAFTRRCWEVCRSIPRGQTRSYAELASRAGSAGAARAAGQAMQRNPLPIILPCHRVVNSAGELHGYAGQTDNRSRSIAIKRRLLDLESGQGN